MVRVHSNDSSSTFSGSQDVRQIMTPFSCDSRSVGKSASVVFQFYCCFSRAVLTQAVSFGHQSYPKHPVPNPSYAVYCLLAS